MPWHEIQIVAVVVMFGVIVGLIVSYLSARKMKAETKSRLGLPGLAGLRQRTTKKARSK